MNPLLHDDVIKWKHFPHYWPFVRGIHQSPVNSPHKGQWCGALMFTSICTRINGWVNNCEAGDLRCHCTHYDVVVMCFIVIKPLEQISLLWCHMIIQASHFTSNSNIFSWGCLSEQQRKYQSTVLLALCKCIALVTSGVRKGQWSRKHFYGTGDFTA